MLRNSRTLSEKPGRRTPASRVLRTDDASLASSRRQGNNMSGQPWAPHETRWLTRLWGAGLSTPEIAEITGRSINAITNKRPRLGLPPRFKRVPWTVQKAMLVVYYRERGYSWPQVGCFIERKSVCSVSRKWLHMWKRRQIPSLRLASR